MDFHSLTRKELQSLCKLNKIPANTTNVAMADALQSLDIVEGIEKFITVAHSETLDLNESKENVEELSSPKAPKTRCRTTNRKKVNTTEPENIQPTDTRTTRRTAKKLPVGVEESKNDALVTPALSSTKRRAMATSSIRNVNSQLNDCELEAKEDEKSVVTKGRRKVAVTSTTTVKKEKAYVTRRSTRQTEKKSGEPRVRKESGKAVEINSMLDEMNVASDEVLAVDAPESIVNAGNTNAEVEDICNAFEEVDINEEKEESVEDENLKPESDEISNLQEPKACENDDLEEEKFESEVMAMEEHSDIILDDNSSTDSEGNDFQVDAVIPCNTDNVNGSPVLEMNNEAKSEILNTEISPDDENSKDNMDDETLNVIPTIDNLSPITEEVEDMSVTVSSEVTEDFEENNQLSPNLSSTCFDLFNKSGSKNECEQESKETTMIEDAFTFSSRKSTEKKSSESRVKLESYVKINYSLVDNDVTFQEVTIDADVEIQEVCNDSSEKVDVDDDDDQSAEEKEEDENSPNPCEQEAKETTEKKSSESIVIKEIENAVKIDYSLMKDEKVEDVGESFEKVDDDDEKAEEKEEDVESLDEFSNPCENGDLETNDVDSKQETDVVFEEEKEEHSEMFLDDNVETESGSLTMVNENMDDVNIFNEDNNNMGMNVISQVDGETLEKAQVENQASIMATSVKKTNSCIVSDDKENNKAFAFKNKTKKEDYQGFSLGMLRKQLKQLSLNNNNKNQDATAANKEVVVGATARPALQALCDNQLVGGGETKN